MPLSTYAELQTSVQSWLNRDDLDAFVPDFIRLVEAEVNRDLRVRGMLVRAVTVPSADEPRELLPPDFLELKAIQFNANPIVVPEYVTPAWLRAYRKKSGTSTGVPRFYTIEAGELFFDVTPSDVQLEVLYYQRIPSLSDTVTQNWLLLEHPDIYLYGALAHSAPFLKDDERLATWSSIYTRAVNQLKTQDNRSEANSAPVAMRPRRSIP